MPATTHIPTVAEVRRSDVTDYDAMSDSEFYPLVIGMVREFDTSIEICDAQIADLKRERAGFVAFRAAADGRLTERIERQPGQATPGRRSPLGR